MRFWLLAMLGTSAAQAQAPVAGDAFCADLRRIVAASAEEPRPFASLPRDPDAKWLGGLASCRRVTEGSDSFYCRVWTRGVPDGRPGLAARVQACLPRAMRQIDDPDNRNHHERRLTQLRAGRVIVDVEEHGGPGVHIGWYYSVEVHAAEN
jgi:hypothetical protein